MFNILLGCTGLGCVTSTKMASYYQLLTDQVMWWDTINILKTHTTMEYSPAIQYTCTSAVCVNLILMVINNLLGLNTLIHLVKLVLPWVDLYGYRIMNQTATTPLWRLKTREQTEQSKLLWACKDFIAYKLIDKAVRLYNHYDTYFCVHAVVELNYWSITLVFGLLRVCCGYLYGCNGFLLVEIWSTNGHQTQAQQARQWRKGKIWGVSSGYP